MRTLGRLVPVLAAVLALGGCSFQASRSPDEFSLIVVTLDTTRADRIGAFGGKVVPTPHLDAMAKDGVSFTTAISQVPLTLPSHSSIFTGKYPAAHGVRHNGVFRLRDDETTLAERLKEHGFATGAVVGAFVLNSGYGVEQGFDSYADMPKDRYAQGRDQLYESQRSADEVNAEVFKWLDKKPSGRFFLWVHYYDPHAPYEPPEKTGRTLTGEGYDREISYMDQCFGDLMDRLKRDGLLDDAILVVAGDHGESLGSHGELSHGVFLYEPAVHVPLFFRAPGLLPGGERIDAPVELVDIAPTLLDLLGFEGLPGQEGNSLVPLIRKNDDGLGRVVHAETFMPRIEFGWSELRMVRDRRFKYVQAPKPELYDLRDDPLEEKNLAAVEPERAQEMAATLTAWVSATSDTEAVVDARRAISAEEEAQLRSLGYLGGGTNMDLSDDGKVRPDPKDHVADGATIHEARDKIAEGRVEEGLADIDDVLRRNPGNHLARSSRIQALIKLKRYGEAEQDAWTALGEAMAEGDASAPLVEKARRVLASVLWLNGKNREAEEQYRAAIVLNRQNKSAAVFPGILLGTAGGVEEAERIVEDVLSRNPDDPAAWAARFELQFSRGEKANAMVSARRLAELEAGDPDTLVKAGRLAQEERAFPLSIRLFEIANNKAPNSPDILGYLGTARLNAGDIAGAERALLEVRRLRPEDPRAPFYLCNIALLRNDEPKARQFIDESLTNDPEFVPPLLNYSRWLAEKGRVAEARGVAESALKRRPDDQSVMALIDQLRAASPSG